MQNSKTRNVKIDRRHGCGGRRTEVKKRVLSGLTDTVYTHTAANSSAPTHTRRDTSTAHSSPPQPPAHYPTRRRDSGRPASPLTPRSLAIFGEARLERLHCHLALRWPVGGATWPRGRLRLLRRQIVALEVACAHRRGQRADQHFRSWGGWPSMCTRQAWPQRGLIVAPAWPQRGPSESVAPAWPQRGHMARMAKHARTPSMAAPRPGIPALPPSRLPPARTSRDINAGLRLESLERLGALCAVLALCAKGLFRTDHPLTVQLAQRLLHLGPLVRTVRLGGHIGGGLRRSAKVGEGMEGGERGESLGDVGRSRTWATTFEKAAFARWTPSGLAGSGAPAPNATGGALTLGGQRGERYEGAVKAGRHGQ